MAEAVALRAWSSADADALAAAWAVPDIAGRSSVPGTGSTDDAVRWIAGAPVREATGVSVDRVVGPVDGDAVWGEVGLARLVLAAGARRRQEWEVGWWVLPEHRRRGLATAAGRQLVTWALSPSGLAAPRVLARIAGDAVASQAVAAAIGLRPVSPTLWST